jgi:hypothetical protein
MIGLAIALAAAAPASAAEPTTGACQLRSNYDFLRDLAFTSAATQLPRRSADLARLRRTVRAEGFDVQSVSYDPATGRLGCRMTLKLTVPPAARSYFGGDSLGGPVRYWAEPQDDAGGYSVLTQGIGPIAAKIAAAAARFPEAPDFGAGSGSVPAASSIPTPTAAAPPPPPAPRPLPTAGFDCRLAATSVERMICDSDALAEVDRTMSQRYFTVRANVHGAARKRLLENQRRFLGRRDSCTDEACLVGLYMARAAELAR